METKGRQSTRCRIGHNTVSRRINFAGIMGLAFLAVVVLLPTAPVAGQASVPAFRAPILGTPSAPSVLKAKMSLDPNSAGPDIYDDEIEELARGLKYDPGLIFKFVHDHIQFDPIWGELKGPYMTWMDRGGTSFDQAALTIALLEHAAEHNTEVAISNPRFVVGEISLSSDQIVNWLRIQYVDDENDIAREILARSGRYATINTNGTANLEHIWVKVTIDGTDYECDPSFKGHVEKWGLYPSDLMNAMEYDESTFMAHALNGTTIESTFIRHVNEPNVISDLTTYSANLINYIKTNSPEHQTKDFIGGKVIEPVEESNVPPALPYTVVSRDINFDRQHIPDVLRTTLRIQHCGIDRTFYSSDIYGRRLTLTYNGSYQPQLFLDGNLVTTGTATTLGQPYDLTYTVNHPYETSDFDCATSLKVKAGGFYLIVNGWGDTGTHILSKHRSLLQQYCHDNYLDTSEQVLGESYALLGMTWLAQTSRMRILTAEATNNCVVNHHMLGITGQYDAPYIDVPINHLGVISNEASRNPKGTFFAIAGHCSAYEHQVLRQLQDCNAVSTVRLLKMANQRATLDKIFVTNSGTWSGIQQLLSGYSQAEKDQITPYVNAGLYVYVPECGDLTDGDWTGAGFQAVKETSSLLTASYIIGDGYSGGCASDGGAELSPSNVLDNSYGAIVDGDAEGAYSTGATDISIGTGSWPFGLSFGREYSSHRRLKDGPLGQGWTHSLDITAKVTSDSFQVLGEDSPRDVAIHIVTAVITHDIISSAPEVLSRHAVASLCETWLMDKMIDNVVNIKQGGSVLQFVKRADTPSDPNEKYIAPSGAKLKLVDTGLPQGTTLRLKDSGGTFRDFDTSGRLANWTDAYGNRVDFTYTSGKLTQVAGKLKPAGGGDAVTARTLSFTYTGSRITSVTDSASRAISYTYDSNNLTSYTNPDGNAVTYEYSTDPNYTGLMTAIYSPIAEPNRVVAVVYDSLGRVKQQIDANDCTWDYYRSRYRVEMLEPNQIDPCDPGAGLKRFSTVTWVNPDNRTTVTKDQMGRQTATDVEYDGSSKLTRVTYPTEVVWDKIWYYDDVNDPNHTTLLWENINKPKSGSTESDIVTSSEYREVYNSDGRYFVVKNRGTSATQEDTIYRYDFDKTGEAQKGRLLAIYHPDANTADGMRRLVEKFRYNNDGQITTALKMWSDPCQPNEPNEMITQTSYEYYAAADGAGLKKVIVDSNGVDPLNITTEYTYDSVGRTISVKDPRGNISQSEYHPSGLLKKTIAPAPFNYETIYEYYEDGKLKYTKFHAPATAGGNNFTADPHGVALWRFEPDGLTIDSLDTNTLTDINSVDESTSDYREGAGAAKLDRSDGEYFSIADSALGSAFPFKSGTSNSKISVCCWVKFSTLTPYPYIFSKNLSGKYGFSLGKTNTHKLQMIIGYSGGTYGESVLHDSVVQAGRWYHVGVTFDNSNKSYRIRVWDATAGAILGTDKTGTAVHNVTIDAGSFNIGRAAGRTPSNYNLDGRLDEFVVFDDILSTTEIDQIRQGSYGAAPTQTDVYLQYVTYNARGQQATVRGPYPEGATQDQMNINYTQYAYDALGRSWKVTDAEGKVTETCYYPDGKVWKVIDPNGDVSLTNVYNADGTLKETLNAKGNSTTQDYDSFVRPKRTTREDNDTFTEREYDEYGRIHSVTHGKITDPNDPNDPNLYTFTYQERSWLKTKETPDRTTTYKYDVLGHVIETADNAGTTTNTYDNVGRVTQVDCNDGSGVKSVSYEYDIVGNRTKLTYPDATYISYQYDQLGRLTKIRNQSGTVLAQYTYDALSRRLGLDYANGAYVDYSYDTASRLLYLDNQTASGQHKYSYTYDNVGNRTIMSVTDSGGVRNHVYSYDNTYQIKDVNYPTGYDYLATDTTFNYDLLGNRTTVVDGGGTTTYASNVLNQYTHVGGVECLYDGRGNTTYDAGQYMYTYNASNQLVTATKISGSLSAACDTTLSFTTGGAANWLAQTNDANGPDNDSAQSGDISDSQNTWMQTTIQGEGTITFQWKLSSQTGDSAAFAIDGQSQATRTNSFGWEQQSYAVTGSGSHTFKWTYTKDSSGSSGDDCMRVDFVQWTPGGIGSAANPLGDAMESDLNFSTWGDALWGSQTTTYYSGGDAAQSGSTPHNGYAVMETRVDGAGTLTFYWKVSSQEDADYLEFYIDDELQERISGSTSWTQKSYTISESGIHWLKWRYTKNDSNFSGSDCGWVDLVQWSQSGTQVAALAQATDSTLTFTTGGGANWFSQSTTSYHGGDAAQSGSIGANGQSWMQTTVSGPGIIRFYWKVSSQLGGDYLEFFIDSVRQGRISGTTDWLGQSYTITGSGTHTLKWRYTKNASGTGGSDCGYVDYVQSPSPTDWLTITYGYDSAGRRIEKAYDGQTVMKYLYSGPHVIAEYDSSGSLLHKYIYGPGVDQPICMIDVTDGNAVSYYHFDGLGSVIALTNSAGSVVNLYEYSVYGEVSASDPNHPNRFLFTGREFDADTGLYYYRARHYNPYIGRFLQTDPAREGMNVYAYCGNNPVVSTDPAGLFRIKWEGVPENDKGVIWMALYSVRQRCSDRVCWINSYLSITHSCTAHSQEDCPALQELRDLRKVLRDVRDGIDNDWWGDGTVVIKYEALPENVMARYYPAGLLRRFKTIALDDDFKGSEDIEKFAPSLMHELGHMYGLPGGSKEEDLNTFRSAYVFDTLYFFGINATPAWQYLGDQCNPEPAPGSWTFIYPWVAEEPSSVLEEPSSM